MRSLLALLVVTLVPGALYAEEIDFRRQVLPILTDRCFRCHGPDDQTREANLRLDDAASATGELDSGVRAVAPGDPGGSELLARVTAEDESTRMPPADAGERLKDSEVAVLRQWIAEGARYRRHWSFEPSERPPLPQVADGGWVRNGIDTFVYRRLSQEGIAPSPEATRELLVRRVSLALTGLPPSMDQVSAFLADHSPDAYERLVDRLLASPAYGERWARPWLDLARYADSAGYAQDPPRVIWMYRDWVIQALNRNLPFDQFTIDQLAGDMLPESTDEQLIATAFHRNTMTNSEGGTDDEEFRNAAVVDRVNTTMQVWMGLTMGCAQCHSHKYDPITNREYFEFLAVFNNTEDADRGDESPTLATLTMPQQRLRARLQRRIERLQEEIRRAESESAETESSGPSDVRRPSGPLLTRFVRVVLPGDKALLSLAELQALQGDKNLAPQGKASQVSTAYDGPAALAIDGNTDGHYFDAQSTTHTAPEKDPWWELQLSEAASLDAVVIWNRTDGGNGARLHDFHVVGMDAERRPLWIKTVARPPDPQVRLTLPKRGEQLSEAEARQLASFESERDGPAQKLRQELKKLQKELDGVQGVTTPIMRELAGEQRRETHIQIRGNFLDTAERVRPGVPAAFHQLPEGQPANRLTVARWIVNPRNPLTARVAVNRLWEQLFGVGLVETSEDFGLQGEPPSHPQLLDYLAEELVRSGWDVKALLRLIVTSATYRQSTAVSAELEQLDPANRLLARGPRFRLSAEMIRDQALAVSGLLCRRMHGPSVQPPRPMLGLRAAFGGSTDWQPSPGGDKFRRGLYTSWRRTTPYPSMTTFDAPSREVCTIRRVRTNTPLQALVTLNDPVFVEAAQEVARRTLAAAGPSPQERAAYAFRLCLSRAARAEEIERTVSLQQRAADQLGQDPEAARQLATDPRGPLPDGLDAAEAASWTVVANVLLNLDEFLAPR